MARDAPPSSPVGDVENEYLTLYRSHLRAIVELTRPAFRRRSGGRDKNDSDVTRRRTRASESCRASAELQLTPLSVLYVQTMVAPLRRLYAWGVPTSEALDVIERAARDGAAGKGVVEIGAGTGYWTFLLRRRGVSVKAFDLHPCHSPDPNGHHKLSDDRNPPPFARVESGGAEAAREGDANRRVLLLCWPPRENREGDADGAVRLDVSGMALAAIRAYQGSTVVYVGEVFDKGKGGFSADQTIAGATAGPAFHRALRADWILRREVMLPRWPGAADSLTVWSRRSGAGEETLTAPPRVDVDDATSVDAPSASWSGGGARGGAGGSGDGRGEVADQPVEVREGFMRGMRRAWEETAVAHMLNRARHGGTSIPGRGIERRTLDAVRSRSGVIRKLLLAFL